MIFNKRIAAFAAAVMMLGQTAAFSVSAQADPSVIREQASYVSSTTKTTAPKLKPLKTSYGKISISWQASENAQKYIILRRANNSGLYTQLVSLTGLSYIDTNLTPGVDYTYKVGAVAPNGVIKYSSITGQCASSSPYYIAEDTIGVSLKTRTSAELRSGIYTGYVNSISYPNKIIVHSAGEYYYINKTAAKIIDGSGYILPTSAISQLGEAYYRDYACGPASVAELISAESGKQVLKEDIIKDIRYSGAAIYGDSNFFNSGMPFYGVFQFTKYEAAKRGIKNKTATFEFTDISSRNKIVNQLKRQAKNGRRAIIGVCSSGGRNYIVSTATHYVVLAGYQIEDGKTFFYIADPYYSEGSAYIYAMSHGYKNPTDKVYHYGLYRVSADVIAASVTAASVQGYDRIIYLK